MIKTKMKKVDKDIFKWWGAFSALIVLCTVPYWIGETDSGWIWGSNISFVFISMAGIMKAIMDTLQFHYDDSIFYSTKDIETNRAFWWNPEYSWANKYIDRDEKKGKKKWFKIIPIPVLFTDSWHLFQSFQINFLMLAIIFYTPIYSPLVDFVCYSFLYRSFFFLFYKYFLIKK